MTPRSDFCLASSPAQAEGIVRDLHGAEFSPAEISLLRTDPQSPTDDAAAGMAGLISLSINGVVPLLSGGPITKAMGKANVRSVGGGLIAFGVPDVEAARYAALIQDNHVLVAVHTANSDRGNRAREIFKVAEAVDIFTIMAVTTPRGPLLRPQNWSRAAAG